MPWHSASSAYITPFLNLENHSKTCGLPTVYTPNAASNTSKVSAVFFQFKAKFYADMLFFPVCQILDIPTCNEQDSTQQSHMLQPSSMQEMPQHMLLSLHLAEEVHASNSSVIS
jgi:hypothetical protein